MSEQRLTFEQEAAQVLEQMARLKRENLEATEGQRWALAQLDAQAKDIWDVINQVNAERDAALAELEARARELGLRAEQTIKTEHGSIAFRAGYLKITYDAKGLDAVAKSPDMGWLRQYRAESSVSPTVSVKVEVPDVAEAA